MKDWQFLAGCYGGLFTVIFPVIMLGIFRTNIGNDLTMVSGLTGFVLVMGTVVSAVIFDIDFEPLPSASANAITGVKVSPPKKEEN